MGRARWVRKLNREIIDNFLLRTEEDINIIKNSKSEVVQFEDTFAGGEWEGFESQFRRDVVELIPDYLIPSNIV